MKTKLMSFGSGWVEKCVATLALTPALSPGEREQQWTPVKRPNLLRVIARHFFLADTGGQTRSTQFANARQTILPLPGGEGRGEGERKHILQPGLSRQFAIVSVCSAIVAGFSVISVVAADSPKSLSWTKRNLFVGPFENCTTADLNKDGHVDIIYGPYWFAGPDFAPRAYRAHIVGNNYHRNNSDHVWDVDGDGWTDIVAGYWDTNGIWWYKNPGDGSAKAGRGWELNRPWQGQQLAASRGRMEMFMMHDYDGDGIPELHAACYARQEPLEVFRSTKDMEGKPAMKPFVLGAEGGGHGIAFGDVNGDGREDVLCEIGWYERPEGDIWAKPWKLHKETDLSKMHPSCPFAVKDLNQDGRLDIIFGRGHNFGLYWWEQLAPKPDGTTQWKQHVIDESWSQAHCLALADLDGDKQEELIAGKCIWAHDGGDPGAAEPPAVYYYSWDRAALKFTRHTVAAPGEGIALGRQYSVTDLNGDGRPDILAPSKQSFWVLFNEGYK